MLRIDLVVKYQNKEDNNQNKESTLAALLESC